MQTQHEQDRPHGGHRGKLSWLPKLSEAEVQRHKLTFVVFVLFILVYLFEARTYYLKKNSLKGGKKE